MFTATIATFLLVGLLMVVLMANFADPVDPRAVLWVLALGFLARAALALVFDLVPGARIFHDDASGAEGLGPAIAAYWRGEGNDPGFHVKMTGSRTGYFYVAAVFSAAFGDYRVIPSLGNALIGVATCACIYRLAYR